MTFDYPVLTLSVLNEIIKDGLEQAPPIKRIGLIGSYAREEATHTSDVDLIIDTEPQHFEATLASFGNYVSYVLDSQFNKRLELVPLELAQERAVIEPPSIEKWYYRDGYRQMLQEVKWIYEK